MTDNTQDLDEILRQYPRLPHEQDEIRHALLDWHNKQIEVIIEATYDNLPSLDKLTVGNEMSDGYDQGVEAFRQAIEAERNKLKENTDE